MLCLVVLQVKTDTTSGGIYIAPTPDAAYRFRIYYNKMPVGLGSGATGNSTTYLSNYFPQGFIICLFSGSIFFFKRSYGDVDTVRE
jgi:hypothetical protein